MVKLEVVAPNKQKVELEFEPSATFGDVKIRVEEALGVPRDKQRLLLKGKERKVPTETLAAANIGASCKVMLMLMPGYTMPAAPAPAAASGDAGAAADPVEAAPVDMEGELPLPDGVEAAEHKGLVHVRQGRNRYHITVPQGLAAATFGQLAEHLCEKCLGAALAGLPPSQLRFLHKGKTPASGDALGAAGDKEANVMLLFREGFHVAADGAFWLKEALVELGEAEAEVAKLAKRIEGNLIDAEMTVRLLQISGVVETLKQSVDSVRVSEVKLPEMQAMYDRVVVACAKVDELRKKMRL